MFKQRDLVATIQPGYVSRDQIVVLRLIKDAYPERPIYFSTGGYSRSLGLGQFSLRQGLAERLVEAPITPSPDTIQIGDSYMDLKRTYALWREFKGPKALVRIGDWIDRASFGIPYTYAVTGTILAEGLAQRRMTEESRQVQRDVIKIVQAARLQDLLTPTGPSLPAPSGDTQVIH
jgi:hypothetical protein